jgi:hypothetical protein
MRVDRAALLLLLAARCNGVASNAGPPDASANAPPDGGSGVDAAGSDDAGAPLPDAVRPIAWPPIRPTISRTTWRCRRV